MELRHLRYFQAVAETLSFRRAAERLRVAQPAISRQISALERELGVKLLIRSTKHVQLTEAGRHFLREVNRLLAQLAIAVTGTHKVARGRTGEFRLGSDWRLLLPQIPATVVRYRAKRPEVAVNCVELPAHAQIDALRDGRIHLGFVHSGAIGAHADLGLQLVHTTELNVAVSADHRLGSAGSVSLVDLRDETWIRLNEDTYPGFRTLMIQYCRPALFTPKFGRLTNSVEGMLALVAMGDGICLAAPTMISRPHPDLRFLKTDCPPFEFYAVWLKHDPTAARDDFLRLLREILETSAIDGNEPDVASAHGSVR